MTGNNYGASGSNENGALVEDYMSTRPVTLGSKDHILDVAKAMAKQNISSIAITTTDKDKDKIIGIMTERDIVKMVAQGIPMNEVTAGSLMSSPPITVNKASSVEEAAWIMVQKKVRHLLVEDFDSRQNDDKIVGIITVTDIARYLKHTVAATAGIAATSQEKVDSSDRSVEFLRSEVWELFF